MTQVQRVATITLTLALAAAVLAGAWWLASNKSGAPKADKPAAPAAVVSVVKEADLNTVKLTEEAVTRIGLTLGEVAQKPVGRVRVYGGEVTVPVGRTILVAAPLGGTLKSPAGGVPIAGSGVKLGTPVFELTPLLTPDGQANLAASLADADGQVSTAAASFELTEIALKRAERVTKQGAGSQRQVDEARAASDVAQKTLAAARARQAILKRVTGDSRGGTTAAIPIDAPQNGVLRTVSARVGQTVPGGAALFEVVDLSTLWVRVPLPVGDADAIDPAKPAQVGKLSASAGTRQTTAKPIAAPPSANALAATVDVFYEVPNPDGALTPGQRVGVGVPLAGAADNLTVPWSAVVFDVHGNTWVYAATDARTFARRRVSVRYTVGADAVLAAGPPAGTKVVVAGAQQLFGAETGFIK